MAQDNLKITIYTNNVYGHGWILSSPLDKAATDSICNSALSDNVTWQEIGLQIHTPGQIKLSLEDKKFNAYMEEAREEIVENFRCSMQHVGVTGYHSPSGYQYALAQCLRDVLTNMMLHDPMTLAPAPVFQGNWNDSPADEDDDRQATTEPLPQEKHQAIYWLEDRQPCNNGYYSLEKSALDTYYVFSRYGIRLEVCANLTDLREYMHNTKRQEIEEDMPIGADAYTYVDLDAEAWEEGFIK